MPERERIAKHKPLGPYSPPRPSEVDGEGPEPMAVAGDKQSWKDESFHPTTAPMDQWAPEVAERYRQHPNGPRHEGTTVSRTENDAAEEPPGYGDTSRRGWKRLGDDV